MKNILIAAVFVFICFATLCILNFSSKIISSPDGKKCLTLYRPVSFFWNNAYYVIPYKYDCLFPPKENYALIRPKGMSFLDVNWCPRDGYFLKIAFSSGCERDLLIKTVIISADNHFENYIDNGDHFYYPKYESFPFEQLVD